MSQSKGLMGCAGLWLLALFSFVMVLQPNDALAASRNRRHGSSRDRSGSTRSRQEPVEVMRALGLSYGTLSYDDPYLKDLFGKASPMGFSLWVFRYPDYFGGYMNLAYTSQEEPQLSVETFERGVARAGLCAAIPITETVVVFAGAGFTGARASYTLDIKGNGWYHETSGAGYNLIGGVVAALGPIGIEVKLLMDKVEINELLTLDALDGGPWISDIGGLEISAGLNWVILTRSPRR